MVSISSILGYKVRLSIMHRQRSLCRVLCLQYKNSRVVGFLRETSLFNSVVFALDNLVGTADKKL